MLFLMPVLKDKEIQNPVYCSISLYY